ncbi:MAG: adenine deaminase [Candidatus Izemoplasmatales bacterium]|nr:adenine deaminase [Candidatus Izemoplasmatales bacterium]
MNQAQLSKMALGKEKAPLVLKNATIVNVFTHSLQKGDIAIAGSLILGIGSFNGEKEVDLEGKFVAPGFFDAHVHIESSMLVPSQFAKLVMPKGTTSIIADPHEIGNVCGVEGIDFMMSSAKLSPLDVFMMMPSCVPSTIYETTGKKIGKTEIIDFEKTKKCFGLGEVMDYPNVISGGKDIYDKIDLFSDRVKDGHAPFITGLELNSYLLSGIKTDHESSTKEEMLEKVEKGMYVMLREGSATRNVEALTPFISEKFSHRLLFCTDDKHPKDIVKEGHINFNINKAILLGLDPITAIQMATINTATAYHLEKYGAIAPGYFADIVVFNDLYNIEPTIVYKKGELVADGKKYLANQFIYENNNVFESVHIDIPKISFKIPLKSNIVHVIGFEKNNVTTTNLVREVLVENGLYIQEKHRNILKLAIVERHHFSGNVGLALIEGYGLQNGAIAMTIAHDSHNLVIIGDSDEDMMVALHEINRIKGGIAIVSQGKVLSSLELEVAGLMTQKDYTHVCDRLNLMNSHARKLGVSNDIDDPFLNLAFLSLPVIPKLKVTDFGLFDVEAFKLIPLEVDEA